ncbi:septum site-determining protein MinC [Ectothiorhodospiraceae bacterium WFHF3C12]|nr:septum site-determining protein MinC [Ectothiorhodospiraceae bacterium WFHF3C12]
MASTVGSVEQAAAFELKGRMATLTVLRLLTPDNDTLNRQLEAKVAEAPSMLRGLPVVLELSAVAGASADQLALWLETVRGQGLVPVGISGAGEDVATAARERGIGVFPELFGGERQSPKPGSSRRSAEPEVLPGRVIDQPVRSGQQVYARGGDLVVLASVSPGAEVLADGNIHVYGTLRGRALAGVQGNREARIFCRSLRAELVSIAGQYQLSEHLGGDGAEGPVQVYLEDEALCIVPLEA